MTGFLIGVCDCVIFIGVFIGIPAAALIALNASPKGPRS